MKQRAIMVFLLACLAAGMLAGCEVADILMEDETDAAKHRVTTILEGIKEGESATDHDVEGSVCRWFKDVHRISDLGELGRASDGFDGWRREGRIYPTLRSYQILGAEIEEGAVPTAVIISGTINGRSFKMRVPEKQPISWVRRSRR